MRKPLLKPLFLITSLLISINVLAFDFESDGIYYNINGDNVAVTRNNDARYAGDVVIPSSVTFDNKTYQVTEVADYTFSYSYELTSVTLPEGVTKIGNFAFMYSDALTSVTIPASITQIGSDAFDQCNELSNVYITDLTKWLEIDFESFCSNPIYPYTYGAKLFLNGDLLTTIEIPNGITEIKQYAFNGYESMSSLTIPNSVTTIGYAAFQLCSGLTSITIPESVTSIGAIAFLFCDNLTNVTLPSNITTIESGVFCGCGLTTITIPEQVTKIDTSAFQWCDKLASINTLNSNPPLIDLTTFDGVDKETCILYVPYGSKDAYQSAQHWNEFVNIIETDFASIADVETDNNNKVEYYNLQGIRIKNPENGVYIKRQGNSVTKVIITK